MGVPPPRSIHSRILLRPVKGQPDLEEDAIVVEPGEPGYEEAGEQSEFENLVKKSREETEPSP